MLVQQFITDELGFSVIPGGTQRFHFHVLKPASNDKIQAYVTIELANSSGVGYGTILSTGDADIGWVDASTPVEVLLDLTLSTTTILTSDRMIVKIYFNNDDSTSHSATWYTEGVSYYAFVLTSVGAIAGTSGTSGVAGSSGSSGSSGQSGAAGSSGSSGQSGSSGTSGQSGTSGTSGTGFSTIANAGTSRILTSDGTANAANAESNLKFDGTTLTINGQIRNVASKQENVSVTNGIGNEVTIFTLSKTSNYAMFFDYWIKDEATPYGGRAGTVLAGWDASTNNIQYSESYTPDINSATDFYLQPVISGSNIVLKLGLINPGTKLFTVLINARAIYSV